MQLLNLEAAFEKVKHKLRQKMEEVQEEQSPNESKLWCKQHVDIPFC